MNAPVRRRDVIVPLTRNNLVVFIYGLAIISGVQNWKERVPGLPGWGAWPWYCLLVVGGLVAVVGSYWRDAITGLLVTRAALVALGFGAYAWAFTVMVVGASGVVGGIILVWFGVAAHLDAVTITRQLRTSRRTP